MSSAGKHLACCPRTAAGSRALAGHLRDGHGTAVSTSPNEDHAARSGARGSVRGRPARAAARPRRGRPPAPAPQPGTRRHGTSRWLRRRATAGHEHTWACASRSTARTSPTAAAAARPRPEPRSA
jgi:hypothetical protein